MKINSIYKFILFGILMANFSCSPEETEPSTITRFQGFGFGVADKITVDEVDSTYQIVITFDDNQIFDFDVDIAVGSNSTATEDVDYALGAHSFSVATLEKTAVIEFQVAADVFLEQDEKVYLTLTSNHPSLLPTSKTIEVTIKNIGGCPEYVHSAYVGDYEVVSDGWNDWAAGSTLTVEDGGANILSFKYNCSDSARAILLTVDPATFGISGDKQEYCSYSLPPITKFFGDVVEDASMVNTCDKQLIVSLTHTDANNAAYGDYVIVLKKK